jgi:hypothetical protein
MSSLSTPINHIRNDNMNSTQMYNQPNYNNSLDMPVYDPTPPPPQQQNQLEEYKNNNMVAPQNLNNSTLINNILNEFEDEQEYQQDMNIAHTQYAINDVNVPPPKTTNNVNMLRSEPTQLMSSTSSSVNNMEHYMNENEYKMNVKKNTFNYLVDELKLCLIVFILFVLLSLHHVNRIIFSFLPQLLLENGQLSLYAILLKGFIATLLYYGFSKLL